MAVFISHTTMFHDAGHMMGCRMEPPICIILHTPISAGSKKRAPSLFNQIAEQEKEMFPLECPWVMLEQLYQHAHQLWLPYSKEWVPDGWYPQKSEAKPLPA